MNINPPSNRSTFDVDYLSATTEGQTVFNYAYQKGATLVFLNGGLLPPSDVDLSSGLQIIIPSGIKMTDQITVMNIATLTRSARKLDTKAVMDITQVSTLANLRARTGDVDGQTIYLVGRSNIFDMGGGHFVWDANSALPDDDGVVIKPSSVTGSGRFVRLYVGSLNVRWFGALGDGVQDDTIPLQNAMDAVAQMFNQVAFPPAGAKFTPPQLEMPAGSYRITNTLSLYLGTVLFGTAPLAYTVECTRIIMDTQGGTVNLGKHIIRPTRVFQGTARGAYNTFTIRDIGFWITNPGSTINARGGSSWLPVHTGAAIYINEATLDARLVRCNFYSMPFAIQGLNTTIDMSIENCEFDTPVRSLSTIGCVHAIRSKGNQFYTGYKSFEVTTGTGTIQSTGDYFQNGAEIDIQGLLSSVSISGMVHTGTGANPNNQAMKITDVRSLTVTGGSLGVSTYNGILCKNVRGGSISGVTLDGQGFNTSDLSVAAIHLQGCNLVVSGNSVLTSDTAIYGGSGIKAVDTVENKSSCLISTNKVSSSYGVNQRVTYTTTDTVSHLDEVQSFSASPSLVTKSGRTKRQDVALNIDISNCGLSKTMVYVSQLSTNDTFSFEVVVKRSFFTGIHSLISVSRDGGANVGTGPHTITPGNTITFTVTDGQLALVPNTTTDPLVIGYALQSTGIN